MAEFQGFFGLVGLFGVVIVCLLLLAGVAMLVSIPFARRWESRIENRTPLEVKIESVASMSRDLIRLNSEIQDEFKLQTTATERLKKEAKTAADIAALNSEALEAARSLVESEMNAALKRSARPARALQIVLTMVGFVLGVGGSALGRFLGWF
jgi:biopolymer transport protein ExbB/TolQ